MTLAGSMLATPPGLCGSVTAARSNSAGIAPAFSCRAWRNLLDRIETEPRPARQFRQHDELRPLAQLIL